MLSAEDSKEPAFVRGDFDEASVEQRFRNATKAFDACHGRMKGFLRRFSRKCAYHSCNRSKSEQSHAKPLSNPLNSCKVLSNSSKLCKVMRNFDTSSHKPLTLAKFT